MGYFDKFKNEGVPFMEGREKGDKDEIIGKRLHIDQFGFIRGNKGDYAVVSFREIPDKFYFGNKILTEMLQTVQADGMEEELSAQVISFEERVSRDGNTYMAYIFE